MKKILPIFLFVFPHVSAEAQDLCKSVAECAQQAMEAAYQSKLALQIAVPKGAVMAFDLESCPDGWQDFTKADGRVLVGAAAHGSRFAFGSTGGRSDIPGDGAHNHGVRQGYAINGGRFGNDNADDHWSTEGASGHNHGGDNMPPYLALKYCERQ